MKITHIKRPFRDLEAMPQAQQDVARELLDMDHESLVSKLEELAQWPFEECDLRNWIPVLDRMDKVLDMAGRALDQVSTVLLKLGLIDEIEARPVERDWRRAAVAVLSFTEVLLRNGSYKNVYNSTDRLIVLLSASDMPHHKHHVVRHVLSMLRACVHRTVTSRPRKANITPPHKDAGLHIRLPALASDYSELSGRSVYDWCSMEEIKDNVRVIFEGTTLVEWSIAEANQMQQLSLESIVMKLFDDGALSKDQIKSAVDLFNLHISVHRAIWMAGSRLDRQHRMEEQLLAMTVYQFASEESLGLEMHPNLGTQLAQVVKSSPLQVGQKMRIASLRAMASMCVHGFAPVIVRTSGLRRADGMLPRLVKELADRAGSYPPPASDDPLGGGMVEALMSLVDMLMSVHYSTRGDLCQSGSMSSMVRIVSKAHPVNVDHVDNHHYVRFWNRAAVRVAGSITGATQFNIVAHNSVLDMGGVGVFVGRVQAFVDLHQDVDMQSALYGFGDYSRVVVEVVLALIMGTLVDQDDGERQGRRRDRRGRTVQNVPVARQLSETAMPKLLAWILDHSTILGPAIYYAATSVYNLILDAEPTVAQVFQDAGTMDSLIRTIKRGVPISQEVLRELPSVIRSVCLHQPGLEAVAANNVIEKVVEMLGDPQYSVHMHGTVAVHVAQGLEELMRHFPVFQNCVVKGMIKCLSALRKYAEDSADMPDLDVQALLDTVWRFFKQLVIMIKNPQTARQFIEGGVVHTIAEFCCWAGGTIMRNKVAKIQLIGDCISQLALTREPHSALQPLVALLNDLFIPIRSGMPKDTVMWCSTSDDEEEGREVRGKGKGKLGSASGVSPSKRRKVVLNRSVLENEDTLLVHLGRMQCLAHLLSTVFNKLPPGICGDGNHKYLVDLVPNLMKMHGSLTQTILLMNDACLAAGHVSGAGEVVMYLDEGMIDFPTQDMRVWYEGVVAAHVGVAGVLNGLSSHSMGPAADHPRRRPIMRQFAMKPLTDALCNSVVQSLPGDISSAHRLTIAVASLKLIVLISKTTKNELVAMLQKADVIVMVVDLTEQLAHGYDGEEGRVLAALIASSELLADMVRISDKPRGAVYDGYRTLHPILNRLVREIWADLPKLGSVVCQHVLDICVSLVTGVPKVDPTQSGQMNRRRGLLNRTEIQDFDALRMMMEGGFGLPGLHRVRQEREPVVPDERIVMQLTEMGFEKSLCERAIREVGQNSAEMATDWLINNPNPDPEVVVQQDEPMDEGEWEPALVDEVEMMEQAIEMSMEAPPPLIPDESKPDEELYQFLSNGLFKLLRNFDDPSTVLWCHAGDCLLVTCQDNRSVVADAINNTMTCRESDLHLTALVLAKEYRIRNNVADVVVDVAMRGLEEKDGGIIMWSLLCFDALLQVAMDPESIVKTRGDSTALPLPLDLPNNDTRLKLSDICMTLLKRVAESPDPLLLHAIMCVCSRLARREYNIAVRFMKCGVIDQLLRVPSVDRPSGYHVLLSILIRRIVEGPDTLKRAIEHGCVSMVQQGRKQLSRLIDHSMSLIVRDPKVFADALKSRFRVEGGMLHMLPKHKHQEVADTEKTVQKEIVVAITTWMGMLLADDGYEERMSECLWMLCELCSGYSSVLHAVVNVAWPIRLDNGSVSLLKWILSYSPWGAEYGGEGKALIDMTTELLSVIVNRGRVNVVAQELQSALVMELSSSGWGRVPYIMSILDRLFSDGRKHKSEALAHELTLRNCPRTIGQILSTLGTSIHSTLDEKHAVALNNVLKVLAVLSRPVMRLGLGDGEESGEEEEEMEEEDEGMDDEGMEDEDDMVAVDMAMNPLEDEEEEDEEEDEDEEDGSSASSQHSIHSDIVVEDGREPYFWNRPRGAYRFGHAARPTDVEHTGFVGDHIPPQYQSVLHKYLQVPRDGTANTTLPRVTSYRWLDNGERGTVSMREYATSCLPAFRAVMQRVATPIPRSRHSIPPVVPIAVDGPMSPIAPPTPVSMNLDQEIMAHLPLEIRNEMMTGESMVIEDGDIGSGNIFDLLRGLPLRRAAHTIPSVPSMEDMATLVDSMPHTVYPDARGTDALLCLVEHGPSTLTEDLGTVLINVAGAVPDVRLTILNTLIELVNRPRSTPLPRALSILESICDDARIVPSAFGLESKKRGRSETTPFRSIMSSVLRESHISIVANVAKEWSSTIIGALESHSNSVLKQLHEVNITLDSALGRDGSRAQTTVATPSEPLIVTSEMDRPRPHGDLDLDRLMWESSRYEEEDSDSNSDADNDPRAQHELMEFVLHLDGDVDEPHLIPIPGNRMRTGIPRGNTQKKSPASSKRLLLGLPPLLAPPSLARRGWSSAGTELEKIVQGFKLVPPHSTGHIHVLEVQRWLLSAKHRWTTQFNGAESSDAVDGHCNVLDGLITRVRGMMNNPPTELQREDVEELVVETTVWFNKLPAVMGNVGKEVSENDDLANIREQMVLIRKERRRVTKSLRMPEEILIELVKLIANSVGLVDTQKAAKSLEDLVIQLAHDIDNRTVLERELCSAAVSRGEAVTEALVRNEFGGEEARDLVCVVRVMRYLTRAHSGIDSQVDVDEGGSDTLQTQNTVLWNAVDVALESLGQRAPDDDITASALQPMITGMLPAVEAFLLAHTTNDSAICSLFQRHRWVLNSMARQHPDLIAVGGSLAALMRFPNLLDFDHKVSHFRADLRALGGDHRRGMFGLGGGVNLNIRRSRIFEDSFHQLSHKSVRDLRRSIRVSFQGEEGVDAGGVQREYFQILSRAIFNENYALFKPSAAKDTAYEPNPASWVNPPHLEYFAFVGRICGLALWHSQLLDAYFTRSVYKHILKRPIDLSDLEWVDPHMHKSLKWMQEVDSDVSVLDLTFSTEQDQFGVQSTVDLKEDGRSLSVTNENKREYVRLMTHYRMSTAIQPQIDAFLRGLYELIPADKLSIFDEKELELLLSGVPEIDLNDIRANTVYEGGYSSNSPQIIWLWRALAGSSKDVLAAFVQFVTGTSRVPSEGFSKLQGMNGPQKLQIHKAHTDGAHLPTAHTCFNQLDLPEYDTYEILRDRLLVACREGAEGFGFV